MEILHFCPSRSFSGLEQYALEMAVSQKQNGRAVGFVVCPNTPLEQECRKNNIETVLFNPYKPLASLKFWPRLRRLLGAHHNDLRVLHLHSTQEVNHIWGAAMTQKLFVSKQKRPKVILQTHIWVNHTKTDPLHRLQYAVVDELWCSSEAARQSLSKRLPIALEQIKIVNYGRNVEQMRASFKPRDEARAALNLPHDSIVIGCVSRIEESKGIREFLTAMKPLLLKSTDVQIAIIGGPSPANPDAEKYSAQLKTMTAQWADPLKHQVHWLGPVTDSYKYLKAFDVYVLPSYQETFSLALLDAQLAGLPVVGSASGGTPDVVINGSTGWLFEAKNTEDLGAKLSAALKESHLWSAYGQTAACRVIKDFDQKRVFETILSEYDHGL